MLANTQTSQGRGGLLRVYMVHLRCFLPQFSAALVEWGFLVKPQSSLRQSPTSSHMILISATSLYHTTQPAPLFSRLKGSCTPGRHSLLVREREASSAPMDSHPFPLCSPFPGMGLSEPSIHLFLTFGWERGAGPGTQGLERRWALAGSVSPEFCSQTLSPLRQPPSQLP